MRGSTHAWIGEQRTPLLVAVCFGLVCTAPCQKDAPAPEPAWRQWGGPGRDFKVPALELASRWPEGGPKRLWHRPLGEGYSAIVADGERLFTMYRDGETEILIALRAADGRTLWEHRDVAPPHPEQTASHGPGPHATPLILGNRVFAIGFTGRLRCVDKRDGKLLWSLDLMKDLGARPHFYGYASSPIVYRGSLIVLVGGEDCGVAALDPGDGKVRWKSAPARTSYASPILIDVDGQDQLVFFTETEVVGMSPVDGRKLWGHKVVNFCRTNCTAALWGEDNLLFAATKGAGGTRVLRLRQRDGQTTVEEVWRDRRMRIYFWNAIRIGDLVYTSTGDTGAFHSVIDVKTGKYVMRERGLGATNGIYADGKLILLDDRGTLLLARPKPDGVEILSRVKLFDGRAWTVPTLVGRTLYVRNRENIMALDLAPPAAAAPAAASGQDERLPDAAAVIDRHVAAFGGKAAWDKIRTRVTKLRLVHVGMDLEDAVVEYHAKPDKRYVRIVSEAFGVLEQGCDGKVVWRLSEECGPVVERGIQGSDLGPQSVLEHLLEWRKRYASARCTGVEKVGGRLCYRVGLTPRSGAQETMFFDAKTHLLARTRTVRNRAGVPPMAVDSTLSDYRRIDGIMIPHRIHQVVEACGTERAMTFLVQSIEHNVALPDDRFELPPKVKSAMADGSAQAGGCGEKRGAGCGEQGAPEKATPPGAGKKNGKN